MAGESESAHPAVMELGAVTLELQCRGEATAGTFNAVRGRDYSMPKPGRTGRNHMPI